MPFRQIRVAILAALAAAACSSPPGKPPVTNAESAAPLPLRSLAWKGDATDVGKAVTISELDSQIAIFSDSGVSLVAGGVVAASDGSIKTWTSSSVIPSADGRGKWMVGVDTAGKIYRLRGDASLEEVSDRYGLADKHVVAVAPLGEKGAAFAYQGGFAVADGTKVGVWEDPGWKSIASSGTRLAAVADGGVRVFDTQATTFASFPMPGAKYAAFDADGRLIVSTSREIYVEDGASLRLRYKDTEIHGLASAGPRVWFAAGSELGTLEADVAYRSHGATLDTAAALVASGSGDVWAMADGAPQRFTVDTGSAEGQAEWQATIQPIFGRVCSKCHLPGGDARIDMSSYALWIAHVAAIEDRVLVKQSMPPAGTTLPPEDRMAIAAWVAAQKMR
jgi:mono/diheme cytochrome c family protein